LTARFSGLTFPKGWFKKDIKTGDRVMNKQDLIDHFAREKRLSKAEAKAFVDLFFQSITDTLAKGDRVEIRGLGAFSIREYDEYRGRNPKTGEVVKVKPQKLPFFKVGKELKERVGKIGYS
jgi:integration host factor subunit beta